MSSKAKDRTYNTWNPFRRMIYRFTDDCFDALDCDSDGVLSFEEVYEIMLLVSIRVNQKAPIPPPPRGTARKLFEKADKDKSGTLSRDELKTIVALAMPRTTIRLAAYTLLKYLLAPTLSIKTVETLSGNATLLEIGNKLVPDEFKPIVFKQDFWKVAVSMTYVSVLGSLGLKVIAWIYDSIFKLKPDSESKKRT